MAGLEMVPGRPVDVIVDASDEFAISRLELTGTGAFTLSTARQVSPPLASASATFAIDVPATLADGAELTLQARAVDLSGNVSTPVSIVLTARAVDRCHAAGVGDCGGRRDRGSRWSRCRLRHRPAACSSSWSATTRTSPTLAPVDRLRAKASRRDRPRSRESRAERWRCTRSSRTSQRASMTVTVRGGIVRGTVLSPQLAPVAGAQVTVTGAGPTLTAVTDADGHYFVEGASGAVTVTVRALDPQTQLLGYGTGQMNRLNGFVDINVVLIAAGAFEGQVVDPTGAPAGANVQVRLFDASAPSIPVSTTFTDAAGRWLFPLVAIGNYVIDATDALGNHGRSNASITASGQEVTVPLTYLGRGVVRGTVRNGSGAGVANASVTLNAQSLFGGAPAVTRNAESDGTFRFDGVFVGSFTVSATDPVSGLSGGAFGTISAHAQEIEANIGLAAAANLAGTVFRADGTTPVAGGGASRFSTAFPARNAFSRRRRIRTAGMRLRSCRSGRSPCRSVNRRREDAGRWRGSLSVNGETRTINVNLLPQGQSGRHGAECRRCRHSWRQRGRHRGGCRPRRIDKRNHRSERPGGDRACPRGELHRHRPLRRPERSGVRKPRRECGAAGDRAVGSHGHHSRNGVRARRPDAGDRRPGHAERTGAAVPLVHGRRRRRRLLQRSGHPLEHLRPARHGRERDGCARFSTASS